jgi:hypothetical protein
VHGLVVAILLFAITSLAVATAFLLASAPALAAAPPTPQPAGLPDGRVVELVSTSGNVGEPYQPASSLSGETIGVEESEHPFQAAEDGEAVTYVGEPAATGGTGETGPGGGNQWLATRAAEGWKTQVITPTLRSVEEPAYQAFAADLSNGIFGGGEEPLTPDVAVGCRSLYSRATTSGAYRALFTASGVPPGGGPFNICGKPLLAGASEDESHVIFQSEAALVEGAEEVMELPPGYGAHSQRGIASGEPCMFGCNLYDVTEGHLHLVNVLEGKPVPNATFGGYPGAKGLTDLSNTISADGSRIFWTDTQPGPDFEHVYVLKDGASTVQVSGAGPAKYWTATPDGRYALYTEAGELWRFDTNTDARERLTAEGAGVLGVIGTNQTGEDTAYVYFVATGVLAANENAEKETATAERPNLYVSHEGNTTFIATLSREDNEFRATSEAISPGGDWMFDVGLRTAAVAPDGHHLVFESVRSLTGYNNTIAPGENVVEVFVFSAADAQLACASCDPTGAPPSIVNEKGGLRQTRLPVSNESSLIMRRWMSTNGNRVFFDSEQPLVPGDLNGVQDVYEWEREGEGTCAAQIPSRLDRGCVFLLSGADGGGFTFLVDADAGGANVFLEHRGPLGQVQVASDRNELYDARVNGGFPQTSLACSGTGCQGVPPAPPLFATPASVTFAGGGNFPTPPPSQPAKPLTRAQKLAKALRACGAKPRRGRAVCERRARRRYGAKGKSKAKRSQIKGSR